MPCNWRELSFGTELEFSYITREKAADLVSEFFQTSYYSTEDGYDTYEIEDFQGRTWKVLRDSSITPERRKQGRIVSASDEYKVELVSPILYYDEDILMLEDLVRKLRKGGARSNSGSGIHIHVGAENFDAKHLKILCNMIYAKQNILERAIKVQEIRKRFCNLLDKDFIEKLNKSKPKTLEGFADIWYGFPSQQKGYQGYRNNKYHPSRYKILNLHNLFSGRQNAIEIRVFNGTVHSGKLKSYIQFCLMLTAQALNQDRASYKETVTKNDRWTMRIWLLKLGFIGGEFRTARHFLIRALSGNCAFRDKIQEEITF